NISQYVQCADCQLRSISHTVGFRNVKSRHTDRNLEKAGCSGRITHEPVRTFQNYIYQAKYRSTNYMYFLWPGILATVLQQVLLLGLALSFASEFENGTFAELARRTKIGRAHV